jgi:hypothetical protein
MSGSGSQSRTRLGKRPGGSDCLFCCEGEKKIEAGGNEKLSGRDKALWQGDCREMGRLLRSAQADRRTKNHGEAAVNLSEGTGIDIVQAKQIAAYKLSLSFSDGFDRVIDFEPFLRESHNPMIRAYLDPKKFAAFTIEHGNLLWDDYGLCFPIADLYENKI